MLCEAGVTDTVGVVLAALGVLKLRIPPFVGFELEFALFHD
jgi:hypothetical protein